MQKSRALDYTASLQNGPLLRQGGIAAGYSRSPLPEFRAVVL